MTTGEALLELTALGLSAVQREQFGKFHLGSELVRVACALMGADRVIEQANALRSPSTPPPP